MQNTKQEMLPSPNQPKTGWPWSDMIPLKESDLEKEWPRITVIMPSFNQGTFIEESIRSVILQGYPNLEFMIFDGGSTDETLQIIKKYDSWITYWESVPDRGQSHAINKGYKRATGMYVAWLNSDDLYYPEALFLIGEAAKNNPRAGMIYGAGSKIDLDSRVILEIPYRAYDQNLISTRFYVLQQSSFIKRSALGHDDMVLEHLHYTMDWELAIRISRRTPVVAIESKIGIFRIYNECKTSSGQLVRRKEIAMVGKLCNGVFDRNYMIFKIFYPIFKYDICASGNRGLVRQTLCHWWRKAIALFVHPDTHMMH